MSAAIVIMGLAVLGLGVWAVSFGLHLGYKALEALAAFIRHELMMRPQNVYFRM